MSVIHWVMVAVLLVAAVPAALFTIQNSGWEAQLSLDLFFGAWKLKEAMPVPHLMWIAFGTGLLAGVVTIPVMKLAFGGGNPPADDYGSTNF
jgi:hypothetical protein